MDAARRIVADGLSRDVDEMTFAVTSTPDVPEVDLLIRTSGELRSNFLLWQIAYAEFYVTDTLFGLPPEFLRALESFGSRSRRRGRLGSYAPLEGSDRPGARADRAGQYSRRQMGHDRCTTRSHSGGRLRALAGTRAAAFRGGPRRRRAPTSTVHPLPRDRCTGGCLREPALGAALARHQA